MPAELICFNRNCRARFPITEVIYNCPLCGGLLEAAEAVHEAAADVAMRKHRLADVCEWLGSIDVEKTRA